MEKRRLKRIILTVLVAALGLSVPLRSQEQHDGNWWIKDSNKGDDKDLHQLLYVQGFLAGMDEGLGKLDTHIIANHLNEKDNKCVLEVVDAYKTLAKYTDGITVGQTWDGLNDFYKDYRNRSISVPNAIDLVLRQIKGENVDGLIVAYRRYPMQDNR